MQSHGFCEVTTPHVVPAGAFESMIDCLEVHSKNLSGELHTSPEIAMKCLLAECELPIYQICRCFRDDPRSQVHFPEFTMLEFYEPHRRYEDVLRLTKEYFELLSGRALEWEARTVTELFDEILGIDLKECIDLKALVAQAQNRRLCTVTETDTWEDIFFKIMLTHVEPHLDPSRPTIVRDYPPAFCTLLEMAVSGWVERFEIYWQGMEICNGGTELVDIVRLKERYERESRAREKLGKRRHPYPRELFEKISAMPPMAGVAIGLERLSMCLDRN